MPNNQDGSRPFVLSVTVDFPDDVMGGLYTPELLDSLMAQLKAMGFSRVYWLYYGDAEPDSYWGGGLFDYPLIKYGRKTVDLIGEPLKAAVPYAHKYGLEIYGVLKPYNTGMSGSDPDGSPDADADGIQRIGGTVKQVIPAIVANPHIRPRRRPIQVPANLQATPVTSIRLIKSDDSPTRIRRENLEIWTSPDNFQYERRDVEFSVREEVGPAPSEVQDYFGVVVTPKGTPLRNLWLEGLDLSDKYIAVTTNFKDNQGDFRNTAVAMVEAYGAGSQPLPIVVATLGAVWSRPRDFRNDGLEFDSGLGPIRIDLDIDNSPPAPDESRGDRRLQTGGGIAFARGKNEYLGTTPCEVYPETRKLWSGWVDRIIDAGVDGIDLRVSHHGSLCDEPLEYGFNEPIVAEYRRRFGSEPGEDQTSLDRISQIRGEHYTSFVRETSERARRAGCKMQVHLHTEAFHANPNNGQLMGFPANVHFDWESWLGDGLVDGVTFRTSWFEAWEDEPGSPADRSVLSNALSDPVAAQTLAKTNELAVPAYLNRYLSREIGIEQYVKDMEAVHSDERFAGFDVYETSAFLFPNPEGTALEPRLEITEPITKKARELGLLGR